MITLELFGCVAAFLVSGCMWISKIVRPDTMPLAIERLSAITRTGELDSGELHKRLSPGVQISAKVAAWLRTRFLFNDGERLQRRFIQAGLRTGMASDVYLCCRVLFPLLGFCLGLSLRHQSFFWVTAIPAAGYLAPDIYLERLLRARRQRIRRGVPDIIDLLLICVDAGLGIDQALMRVGQELAPSQPDIYDEFAQVNREQRAGMPRLQAWRGMATRLQTPEIDALLAMLIQTERFGAPIAQALRTFAQGIRTKRRQRAEELAAKTTIKIIFPLVLFILPALFIVLLGPAILTIMRGLNMGN